MSSFDFKWRWESAPFFPGGIAFLTWIFTVKLSSYINFRHNYYQV